eukprot:TRINITY_DN31072_c0_g1_i4.p1 TRINITY_DN31072_c0_g1~~TRINITY_DN31072_c0_g1_i4.p1  ORF type:complete len:463 (+),score=87.76 TRINITY_DN31072_c0_g1_i4:602-1990(+)
MLLGVTKPPCRRPYTAMEWHTKMQAMLEKAEQNLDPYTTPAIAPRTQMVFHVDRQSEIPMQTQVNELDARLRLCLNELSEVKLQFERTSKDTVHNHIAKLRDDAKRDLSLVEKQVSDELRVVSHDLRCRIADTEQSSREEKRRRDDLAKKLRLRDEQYDDLNEQMRDVTTRLATKIDLVEADQRNRGGESTRHDEDRFDDMRNEVRYQAERMEEAKRQLSLRMDKIADSVRQEAAGMTDLIRSMVRDVWKEHMSAVYTKVNESLESFDSTLARQVERVKDIEAAARHHESFTEAEFATTQEEIRKVQQAQTRLEREVSRANESFEGQKAQLGILRTVPDDVSRIQLGYKRVNETIPALEATSRKHTALIEVMKQIPELVEELRWEIKRMREPVQRQEDIVNDISKRMKMAEEVSTEAIQNSEGLKAVVSADQASFHKTTKRVNNAMNKISELEEEVHGAHPL